MKNLYILAEKFAALTSEKSIHKLAAGRKHRKQLEKDLAYAKDVYNRHRSSLNLHEKNHADLGYVIDKERKEVERYRSEILKCYDVLRNMDLNDISEVRFHSSGDVGYVKNNRLFRLDDDGKLVPFKRKKSTDEFEIDDESDESDEDDLTADDLLASLVD